MCVSKDPLRQTFKQYSYTKVAAVYAFYYICRLPKAARSFFYSFLLSRFVNKITRIQLKTPYQRSQNLGIDERGNKKLRQKEKHVAVIQFAILCGTILNNFENTF